MYKHMIDMLDEIVEKTKERLVESKKNKSLDELKDEVAKMNITQDFPFKEALSGDEISIIAEVKRASPSKGMIAEDFDYVFIAKDYEDAGASAISVLTEPYFFKGSNDYLKEISENVSIPILRKDFIIDEYMIWEAKAIGASAVLLIVSILSIVELKKFLDLFFAPEEEEEESEEDDVVEFSCGGNCSGCSVEGCGGIQEESEEE